MSNARNHVDLTPGSRERVSDEHNQGRAAMPSAQLGFVNQPGTPTCTTAAPVTYGHIVGPGFIQQRPVLWIPVTLAPQPQLVTGPPLSALAQPLRCGDCSPFGTVGPLLEGFQHVALQQSVVFPRATGSMQVAAGDPEAAGKKCLERELQKHVSMGLSPAHSGEDSGSDPESALEDETAAAADQRQNLDSGPSYGTGWDAMTEPVMQMIVQKLDLRSQQLCRLVSKHWKYFVTNNLQAIQPRRAKVHTIREKFTSLTDIDFSACENVRNRNMAILASSALKLKSITIGHVATLAHGKPRITNSALLSLSKMRALVSLSLSDCSAITNNSMQVLCALTNLESLTFVRCRRISEKGLHMIRDLPKLRSLAVSGCSKVTEALFNVLHEVPQLEGLHLGHMRLQGERLGSLTGLKALRELTVHGEELLQASLSAMADLTSLTALGMTTCYQLNGRLAVSMLNSLTGLRRLNLQSFSDLADVHLYLLSARLTLLEQLKIVMGMTVTSSGVEYLTSLQNLMAIGFESAQASPAALKAVSKLTGLRAAEFPGTSLPHQLLDSVAKLPSLEVLNVSNYEPQHILRTELRLAIDDLDFLTRCTRLKRLDLSNLVLEVYMASELLARFVSQDRASPSSRPLLEELCLCGCPIDAAHIELLNSLYPLVHTHKNRRRTSQSSTWVWSEGILLK